MRCLLLVVGCTMLIAVSRMAFAGDHVRSDGMGGYYTPGGGHQ